jgi:integrase
MARKAKYYQRPDGLFEAIRTINGKRVAFRGKSCREVDQKILAYQAKKEKGRTVQELADSWLEAKANRVTETTRMSYECRLAHICDEIGGMYVTDVKAVDCQRILDRMADQGFKFGTVRLTKTVLLQMFRYAAVSGDLDASPAAVIELPRGLDRTHRTSMTAEQIDAVMKCREGDCWLIGLAFLLTGCRRGELMALRYEDIDRKAKTISITKKFNYIANSIELDNKLKTEAGRREIPLLPALDAVLPRDRIGLIFHDGNGGPMPGVQFYRMWHEYQKLIGLPENITPHWFRHTYATICRDAGVDIKTAAGFLGHANEAITLEIYTHQTKRHAQEQIDKLSDFVASM